MEGSQRRSGCGQQDYNLFTPLLPHHGLADHVTGDLPRLLAEEALPYDVIAPCQPEQRIDLVYPILIDLITGSDAGQ